MVPRGTLDIGWIELGHGLLDCLSSEPLASLENRTAAAWDEACEPLLCLSVRSGLDLFLQAAAWPPGSEVLVSAITVPDIPRLLMCHRLVPVPLDIDPKTLWIRCSDVEARFTPRTRAILVAHLFGSVRKLEGLAPCAKRRGIMLLEDCAQAYDGQFRGDAGSDVRLFSFGPIKTATALGGAVVLVAEPRLRERMRKIQAGYRRQSRQGRARRLAPAVLIKLLAMPTLFTLFVQSCGLLGIDYDALLAEGLQGFRGADLLQQLRCAPSAALLRQLQRRLTNDISAAIARRVALATNILASVDAHQRLGAEAGHHSHWVLPILSRDPEGLVSFLRRRGFDATRKGSHLAVVAAPAGRPEWEPAGAHEILAKLVFLPVHPAMTESNIKQLCGAISEHEFVNVPPSARALPPRS
jgi:perosamine synthetase